MADTGYLQLDVQLNESSQDIGVSLADNTLSFDFTIEGDSSGRLPYYTGEYTVNPRKVEQTLLTADKSMEENVIVNAIAYAEVSNPQGGSTVTIGYE